MSLKTQYSGQKITTQDKAVVIWETDKRLKSKDGTTKTKFKFNVLVRDKALSLMTGAQEPLVVEIHFSEEGIRDKICLELNFIWSIALNQYSMYY